MPVENAGVVDETAYYIISGRPTRADEKYDNNEVMTVSAGFDGTPDIEVADKASMLTASIDNRYDSDTYYVADIAFNGDGDIVAMYSFDGDMGETADTNAVMASLNADTVKAGGSLTLTVKTVNHETSKAYTLSAPYLYGDKDKKTVDGLTAADGGNASTTGNKTNINVARTVAAGTYAIDLRVNDAETVTVTFKVTAADPLAEVQIKSIAKKDAKNLTVVLDQELPKDATITLYWNNKENSSATTVEVDKAAFEANTYTVTATESDWDFTYENGKVMVEIKDADGNVLATATQEIKK